MQKHLSSTQGLIMRERAPNDLCSEHEKKDLDEAAGSAFLHLSRENKKLSAGTPAESTPHSCKICVTGSITRPSRPPADSDLGFWRFDRVQPPIGCHEQSPDRVCGCHEQVP